MERLNLSADALPSHSCHDGFGPLETLKHNRRNLLVVCAERSNGNKNGSYATVLLVIIWGYYRDPLLE